MVFAVVHRAEERDQIAVARRQQAEQPIGGGYGGVPVADEVEEAGGQVGKAVAVGVAGGKFAAPTHRLVVAEVVVVVEVNVHSVVYAGRYRVSHQHGRILGVQVEG